MLPVLSRASRGLAQRCVLQRSVGWEGTRALSVGSLPLASKKKKSKKIKKKPSFTSPASSNSALTPEMSRKLQRGLHPDLVASDLSTAEHNPLVAKIAEKISKDGPMSMADFIDVCLTDEEYGYYMHRDVFGVRGDFITGPEISQVYGECVALWMLKVWESLEKPVTFQMVEMGPGRGTLMRDIVLTMQQLKKTKKDQVPRRIKISFVEVSPTNMESQAKALGVNLEDVKDGDSAFHGDSFYTPILGEGEEDQRTDDTKAVVGKMPIKSAVGPNGMRVAWYKAISDVPRTPAGYVAHEFLDALPVRQYEYDGRQACWAERMVGLKANDSEVTEAKVDGETPFEFVKSTESAEAVSLFLDDKASLNVGNGDQIEASPAVWGVCENLAERIEQTGGAALLIDYGEGHALTQSVRAIRDHKFEHPFDAPGRADLSAWVDFGAIKRIIETATKASGAAAASLTNPKDVGTLPHSTADGVPLINSNNNSSVGEPNEGGKKAAGSMSEEELRESAEAIRDATVKLLGPDGLPAQVLKEGEANPLLGLGSGGRLSSGIPGGEVGPSEQKFPNTRVLGPTSQGEFLYALGAKERTLRLAELVARHHANKGMEVPKAVEEGNKQIKALFRLVDGEEMGENYKVMVLADKGVAKELMSFTPVTFTSPSLQN